MRLQESNIIEELKEFGWWVKVNFFDNEWMLKKLLQTLEKTKGVIEPDFRVLEALFVLASDYPLLVSQSLLKIARAKQLDRFHFRAMNEDYIEKIVHKLYLHKDEKVVENISKVSDQMMRLGYNKFRIYINPGTKNINSGDDANTIL